MKKLIKKIIIALLLKNKTNDQIRKFGRATATQIDLHPGDYPAFNPLTSEMLSLCTEGETLATEKAVMKTALATLTVKENDNREAILKVLNLWVLIVQGMNELTAALVVQLGWRIKTTGTDNREDMMNSSPIINKINQNVTKKLSFGLLNSQTKTKGKPYGVKGFIPFFQIGGIKPTTHETMTMGFPTNSMKYSKVFAAADLGKQIYICFLWYDGNEAIGPDSSIYSFTLI